MMNGAPVDDVWPVSAAASCPGVVAHIVSEQVMATHAKSKMAANLFRLCFIDFSLGWVLMFRFLRPCGVSFLAAAQMCFRWVKRKSRFKPANFFVALQQTRTQFLKSFSGQTAVESTRPKAIARLRCRLTSTSKAAASRPLTAAEVRTTSAYSGSTAIPNGPGQLGTNC